MESSIGPIQSSYAKRWARTVRPSKWKAPYPSLVLAPVQIQQPGPNSILLVKRSIPCQVGGIAQVFKDQLAYCADNSSEYDLIRAVIDGVKDPDPMIRQLMVAPYEPDEVERRMLAHDGLDL